MRLTKKQESVSKFQDTKEHLTFQKGQNKPVKPGDIAWENEIPHGKYLGKTLRWVQQTDPGYYSWICRENVFESWGLLKQEPKAPEEHSTYFIASSGHRWIALYTKPGTVTEVASDWQLPY